VIGWIKIGPPKELLILWTQANYIELAIRPDIDGTKSMQTFSYIHTK